MRTRVRPSVQLLGESAAMTRLRAEIATAAQTNAKVLILGETGAGKELVAQQIHALGDRARFPLISVNCSGIPDTLLSSELFGCVRGSFTGAVADRRGLIQAAHRGTLFLDELGEMSLAMQSALLRFAESGELQRVGGSAAEFADVRLIAATNRQLGEAVRLGAFREDLFYRLNVIEISVPPLRQRGDDILLLAEHYARYAAAAHSVPAPVLTAEAAECLLAYRWPGNVRELRHVIERLSLDLLGRPVMPGDLPSEIAARRSARRTVGRRVESAEGRAAGDGRGQQAVEECWARLMSGEDFWTVVQKPFKERLLTRDVVVQIVHRGLQQTEGSYRLLVRLFNLGDAEYKRLHGFLTQHGCNLRVREYRTGRSGVQDQRRTPSEGAAVSSRSLASRTLTSDQASFLRIRIAETNDSTVLVSPGSLSRRRAL